MTAASPTPGRATLSIPIDTDVLAKYAGLIGLASAILAVAGIFATTAYLSAWGIPAPVLRLDPLTAAIRSETVVVQCLTLWMLVYGLDVLRRRIAAQPRTRRVVVYGAIGAALAGLLVNALANAFAGPVVTIVGGVLLLAAHASDRLSPRATLVAFAILAVAGAYETGAESGRLIRDHAAFRTPLEVTTRTEVGGLRGTEVGFGWRYDGLYLVFRDGESVYVARPGDTRVWIIPVSNVMAVGIEAAP